MKKLFAITLLCFNSFLSFSQWDSLGHGVNQYGGLAMQVYNGLLYVGGAYDSAGGKPADDIATWNGSTWTTMTNPLGSGTWVQAMTIYNSNLIAGGSNYSYASPYALSQFNGSTWSPVSSNGVHYSHDFSDINTLTVYNGYLIVGGTFDSAGSIPTANIASWNGTNWSTLGSGLNSAVYAATVYNGDLVVGGQFTMTGSVTANYIAEWNGTSWINLGTGLNGIVYALGVYNGNLIAAGWFTTAGGNPANNIAEWNGTTWSNMGSGLTGGIYKMARCLTVFNNTLYVGGGFTTAGGNSANGVAAWNGSSWFGFGSGITDTLVYSLCFYNNYLYASGKFDTAGGNYIEGIARWTGPVGIDEINNTSEGIKIFPNPGNGIFNYQLRNTNYELYSIEVYNMLGQQIYSEALRQAQGEINLTGQPAGIYLYRITDKEGSLLQSGKLELQ